MSDTTESELLAEYLTGDYLDAGILQAMMDDGLIGPPSEVESWRQTFSADPTPDGPRVSGMSEENFLVVAGMLGADPAQARKMFNRHSDLIGTEV